jgi:hypothetical protein
LPQLEVERAFKNNRIGKAGDFWKARQIVLEYPIAEAHIWKSSDMWQPKVANFLEVEIVPEAPGLLQFYASASTFLADGRHRLDPPSALLLDQRNEPVYCGVIEVTA